MTTPATTGNTAGRRRFWITVLSILLANTAAWFAWHARFGPKPKDLLRVESFAPGNNAIVSGKPAISWRFNLDVANLPGGEDPAIVTPAISGKWAWLDSRTLTFEPAANLPRATRIAFKFPSGRLRTADGFVMASPYESAIRTSPLRVTSLRQAGWETDNRFVVEIGFNDRVLPADALAKLAITGPDDKPVNFKLHGEAAGNTVRVLTDSIQLAKPPSPDAKNAPGPALTVRIKEGLAGTGGPLGLEEAFVQRVPLGQTLFADSAQASAPTQGEPHILVRCNGQPDIALLQKVLSIEPAISSELVLTPTWNGFELHGAFAHNTRYAIKIDAPPPGADRHKTVRPGTLSVLMPDREPGTWFEHDSGYLSSEGNRTLLLHAVNVTDLKLTVWRVYDNNLVASRNGGRTYSWPNVERYSQPIVRKVIPQHGEKNKVQDIGLSLDEVLPPDAPHDGVYRIVADAAAEKDLLLQSGDMESADSPDECSRSQSTAVVTLSDIGLTAKKTRTGLAVWAVSLRTAQPLANVRVRAYTNKNQPLGEAISNADGVGIISGAQPNEGEKPAVVLAEFIAPTTQPAAANSSGAGLTWLDLRTGAWELSDTDVAGRPYLREGYDAFIYTDRGVYRPGETVYLRAVVRGPGFSTPKPFPVQWQIRRPDLRDYRSSMATLDADGAAALELKLPDDLPTGRWSAHVGLPGQGKTSASHFGEVSFQVEEFVPNRIKVDLKLGEKADDGVGDAPLLRHQIGDKPLPANVQADYLFGRPASGLSVQFNARLDPAGFSPKSWSGWTFGDAARLIELPGDSAMGTIIAKPETTNDDELAIKLDDDGHAAWAMDLRQLLNGPRQPKSAQEIYLSRLRDASRASGPGAADKPPTSRPADKYLGPWRLSVSAGVIEVGGRAVTASQQLELDLLPHYIGVRQAADSTPRPGSPFNFDVALISPATGQLASADAQLQASIIRETWNTSLVLRDGRYHYDSTRVLEPLTESAIAPAVQITAGRGVYSLTIPSAGSYILRLRDPATGAITSISFYVTTSGGWDDNISRDHPERLELAILPASANATTLPTTTLPKQRKFKVGETAQVLIRSPFAGRLLLAIETDDVVTTRVIDMPASQLTVPIEITDACRPNAYVTATVVRAIDPNVKWRTHRAFGAVRLNIDPRGQRLDMQIISPTDVRPRSALPVQVLVKDANGQPVRNAAVTLAAVDEGILALTRFKTPNPLAFFTANRALSVFSADLYGMLMPEVAKPEKKSEAGGDEGDYGRHRTPVAAKRVKPVSLVSPVLHTDEAGLAAVTFDVPEFAGALRLMAVGYSGPTFGNGEKGTLVRSPLLVQSSFPRFAAPGDRFDVPLILFNNGSSAGAAKLTLELLEDSTSNPLAIADSTSAKLELGPINLATGAQQTVHVSLLAKPACGVAKIRITAAMGNETYEENLELPVRPASPTISTGGYASASTTRPATFAIASDMLAGTDSVDIKVTPWPTLDLPTGLDYLERYPYGCAEQITSTCFPLVYLSDIGKRIAPGVFEEQRVADKVQAGILRLIAMQTSEGGIAMWPGSRETWPWASIYAAHFIVEAASAGHPVPDDFRQHLLRYAKNVLDQPGDEADLFELRSYACYVLSLAGQPPRSAMNHLMEVATGPATLSLTESAPQRAQAKFFLALAWASAGRRDLAENLIPQTPPLPRTNRQSADNIGSPIRDRALLVIAMLSAKPDHPALPALVQQLADAGRAHQRRSTQDVAFATMALGKYLRQAKPKQPYQTAELWLGNQKLASADAGQPLSFQLGGKSAKPGQPALDLKDLQVRLTGDPGATAYVSWLQSGVPLAAPAAADNGMKIRRRYLNGDGDPIKNDTVSSGDLVKVELTIEAPPETNNIVIEDLLPAGLEIENARLVTTAKIETVAKPHSPTPADAKKADMPFADDKLDIRDDRLILVGAMPSASVAKFTYLARAVSPGTFTAPPTRAECMYDIGINSISATGKLTVKGMK